MILAIAVGVVVCLLFAVTAGIAVTHWRKPGIVPFVLMAVLLGILSTVNAVRWAGLAAGRTVTAVAFVANTFAGLMFLLFVVEYSGRGPMMTPPRIGALVGFGILTSLGVVLFPLFDESVLEIVFTVNSILQVTHFAVIGYGTFLVGRSVFRYDELPTGDAIVLLVPGCGLVGLMVLRVLTPQLPVRPLQGPQLAVLGGVGLAILGGQLRFDAFERGPSAGHLAREAIFDDVRQAVFITTLEDRVLDCNETAADLFGPGRDELLDRPLDDVVATLDPEEGPVGLTTMTGHRQFEMRQSTLTDRHDEPIGRAYALEDVTDRRTHEQRLDVLNRVLRHNLRNDLDAIAAFAETLERAPGDDVEDLATRVRDTASELAEIGETVSTTERLLARDDPDWQTVDLVALTQRLVDDFDAAYPDATVQVESTDLEITAAGDRLVFEAAISEVLENALEHNDRDRPHVTVSLESTPNSVRIEVSDDGPGIPDREREVLLDGAETPLRHGSGLGLWFVHWAMVQQGGDLSLRQNQPRGTVVSLVVPDRSGQEVLED